jgi:hypothetical protein
VEGRSGARDENSKGVLLELRSLVKAARQDVTLKVLRGAALKLKSHSAWFGPTTHTRLAVSFTISQAWGVASKDEV